MNLIIILTCLENIYTGLEFKLNLGCLYPNILFANPYYQLIL